MTFALVDLFTYVPVQVHVSASQKLDIIKLILLRIFGPGKFGPSLAGTGPVNRGF